MADFIKKQYCTSGVSQDGSGVSVKKNKEIISLPNDLLRKITSLAVILASKGVYDSNGRIINQNKEIAGSNIIDLISIAMSKELNPTGFTPFIHILKEANINPSLVINQFIKNKLKAVSNKRILKNSHSPVVFSNIHESIKRKTDDETDVEETIKTSENTPSGRNKTRKKPNKEIIREKGDYLRPYPKKNDLTWLKI